MKAAVRHEARMPLVIEDVTVDDRAALMGRDRFPVDISRLVDSCQHGLFDLDAIIADRMPLERINDAFDEPRKGDPARSVIVFDA